MSINTPDQFRSTPFADDSPQSLFQRVRRALGPALPGIVLDLIDAMGLTLRVGPFLSFPLGFAIGIWLSSYYRFSWGWKCLIAIGAGLYTLAPGTEAIPLATILTCLGRFVDSAPATNKSCEATATDSTNVVNANDAGQPQEAEQSPPQSVVGNEANKGVRTGAKCPECESTSLKYGQVGQRFWPTGCSPWSKGHEVNAFVCLDCGFIGHFLSTADLESLEQKSS